MAGTDLTPEGWDDMSRPKGFDDYENFDHLRARGFGFVHPSLCFRYFDVRLSEGRTSPSSLIFNNEPE